MLKVKNLKTTFQVEEKTVKAVDGISFEIPKKTVIGLVGESGSGKSVTALSVMNLLAANGQIAEGEIFWQKKDLLKLPKKEMQLVRGAEIGLIFQNPLAALNPVFSIGNQMIETIMLHEEVNKKQAHEIACDLLRKVNIPDPKARLKDYPHQFSLGMCQRIMIALTIAMKPKLLIADEPTASLDVTIQAQILELLAKLKEELEMSILFISHDLGVIAQYSDYILIMYLGKIVEEGYTKDIFHNPKHPYTQALINSIPVPDPDKKTVVKVLKGDAPSPVNIPTGCRFHTRCPKAQDICREKEPELKKVGEAKVACLFL
jgi:oligopeptide/dipeptide ABC transporter ATP-binding protein